MLFVMIDHDISNALPGHIYGALRGLRDYLQWAVA